jgi:diacylglycerol kinase (ATP)
MNRKIVFLINPISGTSKKDKLPKLIAAACALRQIECEILPTHRSGNYDRLKEQIQQGLVTDVVMCGGDGTVNQVLAALYQEHVQFGIIPFGSGNGLARAAGISMKIKSGLQTIFDGFAKPTDAFTVNGQFSCMLSGLGFDAQVAHDFAAKASRGLLTYTQQSIIQFFKAQPYQFEIVLNNFSFFSDAFFISIANSNQFGNNFTIAPHASLSDGLLDIVIVQKMNKAKLPFAVLRQIRGNNKLQELVENVTSKNILYFQTPELIIHNLKHAPLHIDGEPVESATVVDIKILKNAFKLLVPTY